MQMFLMLLIILQTETIQTNSTEYQPIKNHAFIRKKFRRLKKYLFNKLESVIQHSKHLEY